MRIRPRTVLAAVPLVLTAALPATAAHAAFPGRNGVIAYADSQTNQIIAVRPDGTGRRVITPATDRQRLGACRAAGPGRAAGLGAALVGVP